MAELEHPSQGDLDVQAAELNRRCAIDVMGWRSDLANKHWYRDWPDRPGGILIIATQDGWTPSTDRNQAWEVLAKTVEGVGWLPILDAVSDNRTGSYDDPQADKLLHDAKEAGWPVGTAFALYVALSLTPAQICQACLAAIEASGKKETS